MKIPGSQFVIIGLSFSLNYMQIIEPLTAFEKIKILSDPRRLMILRLLMEAPSSLSKLAEALGRSPAWIRHHLKILERAGLIELDKGLAPRTSTEKYYRAQAGAYLLQQIVLPLTNMPVVLFSGSHDLMLEEIMAATATHFKLLLLTAGSLGGLANLRQGICQVAGAHLLGEDGVFNTSYVRHFFPDREMELITLAYRTQGVILRKGNPNKLCGIGDLTRPGIRLVNRNAGSATRLWLDTELKRLRIDPAAIKGYHRTVMTHTEAAKWIERGKADAALGLQAAAHQHGLEFLPLFEERYDLIIPRSQEKLLSPLFDYLQTKAFRSMAGRLSGYNTAHSGERMHV